MPLVLNEDQALIKDTAHEFCASQANVEQLRKLRDSGDTLGYSADTWRQMAELGWAGIVIPEAQGGTDFGWMAMGAVLEEQGRHLSASPLFATVVLGASALALGGSAAQQELLAQVASGELTLALALEESPHHAPYGSSLRAERKGDGWKLSGSKQFVIDGHSADRIIVVARSAGEAGDRDGLSLFLVDGNAAGLARTRTIMADSRNAANLTFDNVQVSADGLIGSADEGAAVLDPVLDRARACAAAEMLGNAQQAFDLTIAYLKERKQFGVLIGTFQALKHRAADMFTEIELARSTVLDALSALDEGRDDASRAASLAKAKMGDALHQISLEALQMHGGVGMTDEFDVGLFLKRARVLEQAFGGRAFHQDRYAALAGF